MLRTIACLFLLAGAMTSSAVASAASPTMKALTPAVRARIDRVAAERPLDTLQEIKLRVAGNVSLWALSHLALAPEDEREHAQAERKEILQRQKSLPTPPAAERVFRKLVDTLPPPLKPDAFEYTLIVLDQPDPNVFTVGGGLVFITRPLLDSLLADRERGEAALAFVLGNQLGHIGLEHCRRGWQSFELEEEVRKGIDMHVARDQLRDALQTGIEAAGARFKFLYTRRQMYDADLFAWQLCRNAGIALDPALDALRLLALVEHPRLATDEKYQPDADTSKQDDSTAPPVLLRLKRLFLERDGSMETEEKYGLFLWDAQRESFQRCGQRALGAEERPIILLHGFHGSMETFRDYLRFSAEKQELRQRKLLVFRYPNNASLARCGQFLHNEIRRAVVAPERAFFVCYSAGGLVFRYYSEVKKGPFERAVLLTTPNEGTSLTALKYLADLGAFIDELQLGGAGALARLIPEGQGQIVYDVAPDSLFLRYLGHNAELARRYHVFSGECLTRLQAAALATAITAGRRVMMKRVLPRIDSPVLRRQALRRIEQWHLPREISRGDLIVSVRSALLKDAGQATRTTLNHEQFKSDEQVIREVYESIVGK